MAERSERRSERSSKTSQSRKQVQLSATDTMMLVMETDTVHAHTGGLTIIDPSDAPGFGFEAILSVLEERIDRVPRFMWKLEDPSLGLDRPYLVRDDEFDLRRHVKRIGVPSPGGPHELAELLGYLHGIPLDRSRPLWEQWIIEGLADGRVAMYAKTHHCLMDGASGAGLAEALCDLTPDGSGGGMPVAPTQDPARPRLPGATERFLRGIGNSLQMPGKLAGHLTQAVRSQFNRDRDPVDLELLPFNAAISKERGFATTHVRLSDVKALRKAYDVTVNDVVMTLAAGGLRHMLLETGDLPARPVIAMVPISTRAEGDDSLGNQVTNASVPLPTRIANPVEQLRRVHDAMVKIKEDETTRGVDFMGLLGDSLIPLAARVMVGASTDRITDFLPGNVVVSNVRGAPMPLYTAGAKIECMCPMSMLNPGLGLNITAMSYLDRIDFGLVFDPNLVHNAWTLAEGIDLTMAGLMKTLEGA